MELHHPIMSKLWDLGGQTKRKRYKLGDVEFWMMFYLDDGSLQNIYQDMQNYVVIGLMKLSCSNPSDKLIHNIICVVF